MKTTRTKRVNQEAGKPPKKPSSYHRLRDETSALALKLFETQRALDESSSTREKEFDHYMRTLREILECPSREPNEPVWATAARIRIENESLRIDLAQARLDLRHVSEMSEYHRNRAKTLCDKLEQARQQTAESHKQLEQYRAAEVDRAFLRLAEAVVNAPDESPDLSGGAESRRAGEQREDLPVIASRQNRDSGSSAPPAQNFAVEDRGLTNPTEPGHHPVSLLNGPQIPESGVSLDGADKGAANRLPMSLAEWLQESPAERINWELREPRP